MGNLCNKEKLEERRGARYQDSPYEYLLKEFEYHDQNCKLVPHIDFFPQKKSAALLVSDHNQ